MPQAFVHGNPETAAIWGPLVDALASRGADEPILLSPPGFGAPVPQGFGATRLQYRDWLIGELEALGGAVNLVGHDWGAGHVYGVLATRPDLVRTWAADCVGLLHPDYVWHDAARLWQTPKVGEETIAAMVGVDSGERTERMAGLGIPRDIAQDLADAQDESMGRCILELYRSAIQPAMADLGRALAAGDLPPGLVITATEDQYAGDATMVAEMTATLSARRVVLDALGHWWMFDGADAAADALVEHWARG